MASRKLTIEWTNTVETFNDDYYPHDGFHYAKWEGVNEHGQKVAVYIRKIVDLDEERNEIRINPE
jgi:hypothetical protein